MKEGFSWEELSPSLSICVSSAHKFGTDAFLLSDFASPRRKDLCCDLGTGCGIIPLLWFRDEPPRLCYGVDIQKQAVMQLEQSVQKNGLEGRLFPLRADLKELSSLPCGPLDLVTCNPPYKAQGSGILSGMDAEKSPATRYCAPLMTFAVRRRGFCALAGGCAFASGPSGCAIPYAPCAAPELNRSGSVLSNSGRILPPGCF